ncbi:MAG: hypothetical protein PHH08_03020 [Candidatus ainarchaeum sp.]|nr:hypothetical protein [Candidatus ainarchaeum sp.]
MQVRLSAKGHFKYYKQHIKSGRICQTSLKSKYAKRRTYNRKAEAARAAERLGRLAVTRGMPRSKHIDYLLHLRQRATGRGAKKEFARRLRAIASTRNLPASEITAKSEKALEERKAKNIVRQDATDLEFKARDYLLDKIDDIRHMLEIKNFAGISFVINTANLMAGSPDDYRAVASVAKEIAETAGNLGIDRNQKNKFWKLAIKAALKAKNKALVAATIETAKKHGYGQK